MGAVKNLWMDAVQRVGDEYAAGRLDKDDAVAALRRLGFDLPEIDDMLSAALEQRP